MAIPPWLHTLALVSLILSGLCFVVMLGDILAGHPQKMKIMNFVWPITALYFGPIAVWSYYTIGRQKAKVPEEQADKKQQASQEPQHEYAPMSEERMGPQPHKHGQEMRSLDPSDRSVAIAEADTRYRKGGKEEEDGEEHQPRHQHPEQEGQKQPSRQSVFTGVTHCGAGCTLGDFTGDWIVFWAGWTLFGMTLWPKIIGEFVCAYLIGVVFQYFSIVPMRHLKPAQGIWAAIKADTLSITAFEVGMFVWMVLSRFVFFHRDLPPTEPVYWFMMQIAMMLGFATSFPMNWWLIKKGWKEAM